MTTVPIKKRAKSEPDSFPIQRIKYYLKKVVFDWVFLTLTVLEPTSRTPDSKNSRLTKATRRFFN